MRLLSLAALPLLLAQQVFAGSLAIKQGKLSLSSPDGLSDASFTIDPPQPLAPIHLAEQTTFKLSFTVIDPSTNEGILPQQAHLLFADPKGDNDVTFSISVKSNGRASVTLNTAKLPAALSTTHGTSNLTLFLSTSISGETLKLAYPLTTLTFAPSLLHPPRRGRHDLPPRAGEPAFQPQEELAHTFRLKEKSVNAGISLIGLGISLALPWLVLVGMLSNIRPSLNLSSPTPSSSLFLLTLLALELLIAIYWVGLKLYQLIPAFLGLAGVSAYVGKMALAGQREKRLRE